MAALIKIHWLIIVSLALGSGFLTAEAQADDGPIEPPSSDWSQHFQLTTVTQAQGPFRSPDQGANSLEPHFEDPSSVTSTLFIGHRLWKNAYLFVNPEESMGNGLSATHGIAGFPNGEIYRVADPDPKMNLSRLFFQQDFGLGGGQEKIEDDQNQFAAVKDVRRITLVAGKFSLNDYFDNNTYSHDARTQFLNWCLMDNCAWDYAADTHGYTWGLYGELHTESWSFRLALVQESEVANGEAMDKNIAQAHAENFEIEHRYKIENHPGAARLLAFTNQAHMGNYQETISEAETTGAIPDMIDTEQYRTKYGFGLNAEQEVSHDLGLFTRIGWNNGTTESWAFTEVDRDASLGGVLKGTAWKRPDDSVGLALMVNGLSRRHADYLSEGGMGFLIGDGSLNYAPEEILETYYLYKLTKAVGLTADFQFVKDPAYNADRGPVPIYALRMHVEI